MRPIDADVLKEIIGECPENWTNSPEEIEAFNMWHRIMDDIDSTPTINDWVNVKDKMPNDGQDVLAYLNDGEETRVAPCNYYNGVWFDNVMNCVVVLQNITHWMPRPKPPKEESKNG